MNSDPHGQSPIEINIHDTTQIEIKVVHKVPDDCRQSEVLFSQEVYFFVPASIGINKDTYDKESFYKSMTNYIRVKTPKFLEPEEKENCRIDRIMPTLWQAYSVKLRPSSFEESIREIKIFGAYMNDLLKMTVKENATDARESLNHFSALLDAYREMMDFEQEIIHSEPWLSVKGAMESIDEFLSHRVEEILIRVNHLSIDPAPIMAKEFKRRRECDYFNLATVEETGLDLERSREEFNFLMGQLKKFTSDVLYLEVKRIRSDRLFVHISAAFGAALAATAAFLLNPNIQTSPFRHFINSLGLSIPSMFTIIVMVYIFQDRTKDLIRDYILHRFRPWMPDYKFNIKQNNAGVVARCNEQLQYLTFQKISYPVKKIRQFRPPRHPFGGELENILLYSRRLLVNAKSLSKLFRNANTVKDILRYDLHPFLIRMGTPMRPEDFYASDLKVVNVELPKVYHVNVVVIHRTMTKSKKELSKNFTRARLILDKNGIKRIENVLIDEHINV